MSAKAKLWIQTNHLNRFIICKPSNEVPKLRKTIKEQQNTAMCHNIKVRNCKRLPGTGLSVSKEAESSPRNRTVCVVVWSITTHRKHRKIENKLLKFHLCYSVNGIQVERSPRLSSYRNCTRVYLSPGAQQPANAPSQLVHLAA